MKSFFCLPLNAMIFNYKINPIYLFLEKHNMNTDVRGHVLYNMKVFFCLTGKKKNNRDRVTELDALYNFYSRAYRAGLSVKNLCRIKF